MRPRVLLGVLLLSCVGNIGQLTTGSQAGVGSGAGPGSGPGGPGGSGGGSGPSSWTLQRFSCDSSQRRDELPLRRLSRTQYLNTVTDLVAESGLSASERQAVVTALAADFARVPEDRLVGLPSEKRGGFSRLDQVIQQTQVDAAYDVATHLGALLTSSTARVTAVVGSCATDTATTNDAQCLTNFVNRLGRLALRRPVTAAERTLLTGVAGTTPVAVAALADVIALLASMPQFLYHVEEGDPAASGPSALDAWALANRLSYHFWQTSPDAALRQAADTGTLLTDAGYRAQLQRLVADARADAAVKAFFGEWFRLSELTPLNTFAGTPLFDAFAGADRPAADLHLQMQEEIGDLVVSVLHRGGTVGDVLTNRDQFARRADLAKLYGGSPWDGTFVPSLLPEPERAGLLTRGAFLASASGNTRPVMKGLKIRNAFLCETIPPPPPGFTAPPVELQPDLTTREVLEALTQAPGTGCNGCHTAYLNPLGYLTEDFDALGRHRSAQTLFYADAGVAQHKAVNTQANPNLVGVTTPVADARALTAAIAASGEFETCFTRQYFRFAFERLEDDTKDGCALQSLQDATTGGATLSDALMGLALREEFKTRDLR